jgi:hypothetical protein
MNKLNTVFLRCIKISTYSTPSKVSVTVEEHNESLWSYTQIKHNAMVNHLTKIGEEQIDFISTYFRLVPGGAGAPCNQKDLLYFYFSIS